MHLHLAPCVSRPHRRQRALTPSLTLRRLLSVRTTDKVVARSAGVSDGAGVIAVRVEDNAVRAGGACQ